MSADEGQPDVHARGKPIANDEAAPRVWKVAIVGGGCAGLSAAWQLARLNWEREQECDQKRARKERLSAEELERYEVHVYERNPRLGGKGASVRDVNTGRIQEHGLHVWLGFYDNAFRMMRDCYDDVHLRKWGPLSEDLADRLPHGSFEEAFVPEPHIGVAGFDRADKTTFWTGQLPPMKGLPGDRVDEHDNPFTLANYLWRCLHLVKTLMLSVVGTPDVGVAGISRPDGRARFDEAVELNFDFDPARSPAVLIEHMVRLLRAGALTTAAALLQAITIAEDWLRTLAFDSRSGSTVRDFIEALATQTRKLLRDVVAVDEDTRRKTEIIDIVMTIVVGLWRDRVLFSKRGLDAINDIDYKAWLTKHGATKTSVQSRFITGIYDLVFAYRNGDHERPALAAGVALRGALRMFFTYRGAMFWRLRSGMGDAVFAPLYKVLERKYKVRFHFQHELKEVGLDLDDEEHQRVTRLKFVTPAAREAIDQLTSDAVLDHLGCWPSKPKEPLVPVRSDQDWKDHELDAKDFDVVIFALGVKELAQACGNELPLKWRRMKDKVKTVGTRALQVWLDKDLDQLGWHRGSALISALEPPYETWADMTHTLATERRWRETKSGAAVAADDGARSVAYFCGVLPDAGASHAPGPDDPDTLAQFKRLWPKMPSQDPPGQPTVLAKHSQFNDDGSERYTLSLPGSLRHRISPLERNFDNATVAGDWTACGLDAGCIESAVMSGMLAAHAVTGGHPSLDDIVGYHHP